MQKERLQHTEEELSKPVTLGVLFEFTEEVLLPRMSDLMEEKIIQSEVRTEGRLQKALAQQTHDLKDYIDRKLADHTAEMFRRLDERYKKDKQFKEKILELFKRNNIGTPEDIAYLQGIVD